MGSYRELDDYFDKLEIEFQKYVQKFIRKNSEKDYWRCVFEEVQKDLNSLRKKVKEFDNIYYRESETEEVSARLIDD